MIIKRNKEPKNKTFFDRVSPIMPAVIAAALVFQVISAITEAFGVYAFGDAIGAHFIVSVAFAVLVAVAWELLIRVCVKYISKTAAQRFRNDIKLEKLEWVLIALALAIGIPATYYSFAVSKENAHMTFEIMMPERDTTTTAAIVTGKQKDLSSIQEDYDNRKRETERRYADQESAAKGAYYAVKAKAQKEIDRLRDLEKRRGKKYTSLITRQEKDIADAYEVYKEEVKAITDQKAEALAGLSVWRSGMETNALSFAGDGIQEENNKRAKFVAWFNKFSVIWAHFAGLSVVFAILCMVFSEVFKVLAGIEEESHITPESFDPSLFSELSYLAQLKLISPIRNKIRKSINATQSRRVDLEIVTPSTISVTPEHYVPPTVTSGPVTVSNPLRSAPVTPRESVTKSVTEMRYGADPKHALPTDVTPVTGEPVTDFKGSAAPKIEPVTKTEAVTIELDPTVTAKKPKKDVTPVTDSAPKIYMVAPTKAVIEGKDGERETVTLDQVGSRKRSNYGNIKKRKTKAAKKRCKELGDFYADLEQKMKSINNK